MTTKLELRARATAERLMENVYIASSSCHGHDTPLGKHCLRGWDKELFSLNIGKKERQLINSSISFSLLNRKLVWKIWLATYYTDERCEITEVVLPKVDCNEVNAEITKRLYDQVSESEYLLSDLLGYGWCAFPNVEYDIESQEYLLHQYFLDCGVTDPKRSKIGLVKIDEVETCQQ